MPKVAKWLGDTMETLMGDKMPVMQVAGIEYLSPTLKRISFKGPISGMDYQPGYAVAIRANDTEFRNYTVSAFNKKEQTIEIIFHLHGSAPGSSLAAGLNMGDTLRISMPRGQKQYDPKIEKQFVFGDETALGLATSFLPLLKSRHRYCFYFELDEENMDIPRQLGFENYTVFSKNDLFKDEDNLNALPVLKDTDWKDANFILAGNGNSVQRFRRALKKNGISGKIYSKGYWLKGRTGL